MGNKPTTTQKAVTLPPSAIVTSTLNADGNIKSRKRTSFKEFVLRKQLRPEVRAGFKVWLRGDMFHFDNEWDQIYHEYCNRKLDQRRT